VYRAVPWPDPRARCAPARPRGSYGKNRNLAVPFWSTKDAGQTPFQFQIGQGAVIKAWDEGVMDMAQGEVARITASPDYACVAAATRHPCRRAPQR
jgi:hypothetical protein